MSKPNTLTAVLSAASAVDTGSRTITGTVVPYGVIGLTSIGPIIVAAGAVRVPERLSDVKLFTEHDRNTPVGWAVASEDTDAGLILSFKVREGDAGDQALYEASPDSPLRDGLSVELDGLAFSEDETTITDSFLRGVAQCTVPAFDDARIAQVAASHSPEGINPMPPTPATPAPADGTIEASAATGTSQPVQPAAAPTPAAAPAPVPASVPSGLAAAATPAPAASFSHPNEFYAAMVARHTRRASADMEAALSDITQSATSEVEAPAFVGELWDGVRYERRVVPLVGHGDLMSYEINGWRWVTKPAVASYAGDKGAVPSNAPTTEAVTEEAERLAGAHDIDRKYRDFNNEAFFQSYYEAMTESYAMLSDAALVDALEAAATDVTNLYDANGFLGALATGVQALGVATNANSTFALANLTDLVPFILGLTNLDVPAYMDLLGIDPRRIVAHPSVTAGHVIVGTRDAVTFYELPGSPIRVEAVDMVKGGIDAGVFGYYATLIHDAGGLQDVLIDAP